MTKEWDVVDTLGSHAEDLQSQAKLVIRMAEKVKSLQDDLKRARDYGPTWETHRAVVERLERERDSWQDAHHIVTERSEKAEAELEALKKVYKDVMDMLIAVRPAAGMGKDK